MYYRLHSIIYPGRRNSTKYRFGLRGHDAGNSFEEMCENAKKSGIKNLQFALAKTVSEINFDEVGYDADLSKKNQRFS